MLESLLLILILIAAIRPLSLRPEGEGVKGVRGLESLDPIKRRYALFTH